MSTENKAPLATNVFRIVIVVIVLVGVGWGGRMLQEWNENRPRVVSSFANLSLGESIGDVRFKMGKLVRDPARNDLTPGFFFDLPLSPRLPKPKSEMPPDDGGWSNREGRNWVDIDNGKVVAIYHDCGDGDSSAVNQIGCDASGESLIARYGRALERFCLSFKNDPDDAYHRAYVIQKYGVAYTLYKDTVDGFTITEPGKLNPGPSHFSPCPAE